MKPKESLPIAQLADQYGESAEKLAILKAFEKRHEELRAQILALNSDLKPDDTRSISGQRYTVEISARDQQRYIPLPGRRKLYRLWGVTLFLERCSVALKSLDAIPATEHAEYIAAERTGPRHLKAVPLQAA